MVSAASSGATPWRHPDLHHPAGDGPLADSALLADEPCLARVATLNLETGTSVPASLYQLAASYLAALQISVPLDACSPSTSAG